MFLFVVPVGSGILVVLGVYLFLKTKRTYDTGKALSIRISLGWWALDLVHCLLVILSSLYTVWPIPINKITVLIVGSVMLGVGVVLMLAGMIEFRSIGRISGLETSELVTTGIYSWSRNPQYLGWFLLLLGVSLIGSSGLALLYTTIGIILLHLYITRIEEPYLERVFGDKHYQYKSNVPRYLGLHRKRIRKEKNKMVISVVAKVILVSLIVFVVIAVSVALGCLACIIMGIPYSFGFMLPYRLVGILVLASGCILLGWLFKFRRPVDILISTYVTITKAVNRVPFEDSSGRTETLVVQGPYKYVRHPLYFDVVFLMVGWWLLLDYSFLLLSAIFLLLWFNYVIAPFEEKELKAIFGEQYERYSNEVPRIIPLTKRRKPETQ